MKSFSRLGRAALASALLVLVACGGSDSTGSSSGAATTGDGDCKTGGNAAFASPGGTAFALPTGVTLVDGVATGDVNNSTCGERSTMVEYGGDLLPVCLSLANSGTSDVTFTLPAGLFFIPNAADGQNGIMLQDHELTIKAGETLYIRLNLFCANEHCHYGRATDRYTFGNVTTDTKLRELVDLAKEVSLESGSSDEAYAFQQALWDITDRGGSVTAASRALIDKLPKK